MSKSYYDTDLNKKILYKDPIFLIKLNLEKKIGGGNNDTYHQIFDDENLRTRFMYHVHNLFSHACTLLKNIIVNENIYIDKNTTYNENIEGVKEYFRKTNNFDDENLYYIHTNLQLSNFKNANAVDFIILQNHNINTLDTNGKKYIKLTSVIFDLIIDIEIEKNFPNYELIDTYKIDNSVNKNPSYAEYYLLRKNEI
jgi:hypothetical protein